jgi:hypothetical protein
MQKKNLIGHACASHCVIFINKFAAVLAKIRLPSSSWRQEFLTARQAYLQGLHYLVLDSNKLAVHMIKQSHPRKGTRRRNSTVVQQADILTISWS